MPEGDAADKPLSFIDVMFHNGQLSEEKVWSAGIR